MNFIPQQLARFFNRGQRNLRFGVNYLFLGQQADYVSTTGNENIIYQTNSVLRSVIDKKAHMFAMGKFKHYNKNGEAYEFSPLLDFLERPNVLQSGNEWLMQLKIQECLFGNEFIFKLKPSRISDTPQALYNLSPTFMVVHRTGKLFKQTDKKEIVKGYELMNSDVIGANKFEVNEVLHLKMPNPDDPVMGLSPLKSIEKELSNINLALDYRNVIMGKRGAIGILSNSAKDSDGGVPLSETERKRIQEEYLKNYGIGDNQSKVIMTNSALSWQPMSYPTKDLMLFEEIDANKLAIIDLYGLNANIFSSVKGSTFDNVRESEKLVYQDTIIPESKDFCFSLSQFLGLMDKGEWIEMSYEHLPIFQEDEVDAANRDKIKIETYNQMSQMGIINNTQIAEELGIELQVADNSEKQAQALAAAQTSLRGTVGGLTGIIDLNRAVSMGEMTRQTAVNTLVNYYGYELSIAESLITLPQSAPITVNSSQTFE
jgi:phage portal protein BeeE